MGDVVAEVDCLFGRGCGRDEVRLVEDILLSFVAGQDVVVVQGGSFEVGDAVDEYPSSSNETEVVVFHAWGQSFGLFELELDDLFCLIHQLVEMVQFIIGDDH
jgi:hypothetical protein